MSAIETLKGYVNTWDCDENDHLNVQFYFRFFEDAGAHFQALAGVSPSERSRPAMRHVRYHSELRDNQAVRIETIGVNDAQVAHMLYDSGSGRLSATCLETFSDPSPSLVAGLRRHLGTMPEAATPRSVDPGTIEPGSNGASPAGSENVLRTRFRAQHCDTDGDAYDSAFVGFNSDSAAFFWDLVDITRPWLNERDLGRVAMEMKLVRTGRAVFGDLIHIVSRPIAVARSTVTFENRFVRTETDELAAIIQVTGLTMNLKTRRAEPLPDDLRARIEARIAESGNTAS